LLISTEADGANGVRIAVRDWGPGLEPESLDRLFDAFYTTKPDGMGMGLSIWSLAPSQPRRISLTSALRVEC
jgi:signal transduction histidine kinase